MRNPLYVLAFLVGATMMAASAEEAQSGEPDFAAWMEDYDEAFNAKDLDRLAGFYEPDVSIFEGGGTNDGWADYRDHHLGPELEGFENLRFSHSAVRATRLSEDSYYVTSRYRLQTHYKGQDIDAEGLATYIVVRSGDGWLIRHSHTSSRRRRAN